MAGGAVDAKQKPAMKAGVPDAETALVISA